VTGEAVHLFGIAGGKSGEACCLCPTLLTLVGTGVAAYYAFVAGSRQAVRIGAMLAGYTGIVVALLLLNTNPSNDPDVKADIETAWRLFWWWLFSVVLTALAAITVRREGRERKPPAPTPPPSV
jgi:hypothetical protein